MKYSLVKIEVKTHNAVMNIKKVTHHQESMILADLYQNYWNIINIQ